MAKAEIITAEKPVRTAEFAAEELQIYVEKITGARLNIVKVPTEGVPVKIYVGDSEYAGLAGVTSSGLKRDAYRMVSGDSWLAMEGEDTEFEQKEPWARHHTQWARLIGRKSPVIHG